MFRSISWRLFWTNALVLILSLAFSGMVMMGLLSKFLSDNRIKSAETATGTIEYMTALLEVQNNDPRTRAVYTSTLSTWAELLSTDITVVNEHGEVYSSSCGIKKVPNDYLAEVLIGNTIETYDMFGSYYDDKVYIVGAPMYYDGSIIGAVFFNTETKNMEEAFSEYIDMIYVSFLFAMIVASVFIYLQAKNISKPIENIKNAALDIASGNFEKRVRVESSDEIGQLASSFNHMAESVEKVEKMRSSFISDVSHELRTPMTSISGFVAGILDGTIPKERHEEYLRLVHNEANRLCRLTNDMLEMTKMSSSEYKLDMKVFDVCEVMRIAIISLERKFNKKGLELSIDFKDESIMVLADKDSILRVAINLLDNAIKFSLDNTKIKISVWDDAKKVYFSVGNYGQPISEEDIKHIFDRFYKTDRSRGKDKTGAGLGLALVNNIMKLHGQSVWAESRPAGDAGGGVNFTRFTCTLEKAQREK